MTSLQLERCRIIIWILAKLGLIVSSEGCECQLCTSQHLSLQLGSILHSQPPLGYFIYGTHILKLFFLFPVVFKELLTLWFRLARIYFAFFWKWDSSCWCWCLVRVHLFLCAPRGAWNLPLSIPFNLISPSASPGSVLVMNTSHDLQNGIKPLVCGSNVLWIYLENSSELSKQLIIDGRGLFKPRSQFWTSLSPGAEGSISAQICSSFCPVLTLTGCVWC